MRKRYFFLVSLAAILSLASCGRKPSSNEPSSVPDDSSEPAPAETRYDTVVEPGDVELNFAPVMENAMVAQRVKKYYDDMKEQEKTLALPYRITPLYGPADFGEGGSETSDGVTYDEAKTGGVDVCQYLTRTNGNVKNVPIEISWEKGDDFDYETATVNYWTQEDKSDLKSVETTGNSVQLANLYRATRYYYQVEADYGDKSQVMSLVTGDYARTITMGGINNVRDIGGYMTSYGVRTNQGLIYRGYEIVDKSFGQHGSNYGADAEKVNQEVMHISHEIDLKGDDDFNAENRSCLKQEDGTTPIAFSHLQVVAYDGFLTSDVSKGHLHDIYHILANADEEHVYFHCWGGADRTGMIAFFTNAILGVSYTDLIIDFELTTETNNKRCHMHNASNAHFPDFLGAFTKWSGYDADATVNANCEAFLLENGVEKADIEKIRSFMIPGYETGMEEIEPQYTPNEDKWESNDEGHWHGANENPKIRFDWEKHSLVKDDSLTEEASCQQEGKEVATCSKCGKQVIKVLPKTDHDYGIGSTVKNSLDKDVTEISCYDCGANGYQMKFLDCDDPSKVSSGKVTNGSTLTWKFVVDKPGQVSFVMFAKLGSGDNAFSNGGEKGNYALKAGNSDGEITCAGHKLSEYGATSSAGVYFQMGVVTITENDIDNGEVAISLTYPTTQDYRHVYSENVRILYID